MDSPSSSVSWWGAPIELACCELHRLEKRDGEGGGSRWHSYRALDAKRKLALFEEECTDLGFVSSAALRDRGDQGGPDFLALDEDLERCVVLGNRAKSRLVSFDKSIDDESGKLSLFCTSRPLGSPSCAKDSPLLPHAQSFQFRVVRKRCLGGRGDRERYTLQLRCVWSPTEVLELLVHVDFDEERMRESLGKLRVDRLRVPIRLRSLKTKSYWSAPLDAGLVACDKRSGCCDETFVLSAHLSAIGSDRAEAAYTVEARNRVVSCDAGGALALVPKHEMRGHEGLSVDQARFGEGKFRIRTKQGTLLCAEKPSKAKAEEETAGGRGISARSGARRGRAADFGIEVSEEEVCLATTWGAFVSAEAAGDEVRCAGEGGRNSRWKLTHHGSGRYTIALVPPPAPPTRRGRKPRPPEVRHVFVDEGCVLRTTTSSIHAFPSRTSLFHIRPKILGGLLCFSIASEIMGGKRVFLSATPGGGLGFFRGRAGVSEHFFIFSQDSISACPRAGGYAPASLQHLTSWHMARSSGGYPGALDRDLFDLMDASGCLWRPPACGLTVDHGEVCACCGEPHAPLDPELNPKHYRYLEVQFRRVNGGTANGRNISPQSIFKAFGTVLAFLTIITRLRSVANVQLT